MLALQLRPEGTESRSILLKYAQKNDILLVGDICLDGTRFIWRSVLEFELRLLRLPIMILNDMDIQLLHGKGIKMRLLVYPGDWAGRDMYLVLACEIIEEKRFENPVDFLHISAAIDLHEESR